MHDDDGRLKAKTERNTKQVEQLQLDDFAHKRVRSLLFGGEGRGRGVDWQPSGRPMNIMIPPPLARATQRQTEETEDTTSSSLFVAL